MKMISLTPASVVHLLLVSFIGVGMFLVWYSTKWGAGLISDTFQYVASARNLVVGNGFSIPYGDGELEPMTKYPPMYSIVLAVFELGGATALQNARWVNMLLFGVNTYLIFISSQKLTGSYFFALLASVLFSISFVLIEVHSWALSEPLYICLTLCTFLLLEKYFKETKRIWLILASLLAASAFLTRYVGLSLVVAAAVVILLGNRGIKQKLMDILLFGLVATLPVVVWTVRGYRLTETLNDRTIAYHPLTLKNYGSAIDVVMKWFLPSPFVEGNEKLLLILISVLFLSGAIVYWLRFSSDRPLASLHDLRPKKRIILLHIAYLFAFPAMIVFSKTWVDPEIGLSDRVLSPMLVSLLVLLVTLLSFLWNRFRKTRVLVLLISFGLITYYLTGTILGVQRWHEGGIGIARRGWNRSEVIQALRTYSSYSIYTNSNSSLYLWSDRAGYSIKEFESLKQDGTDKEVLLIIFHHVPPTGERLNRLIDGLTLLKEDRIVSIYEFGPAP